MEDELDDLGTVSSKQKNLKKLTQKSLLYFGIMLVVGFTFFLLLGAPINKGLSLTIALIIGAFLIALPVELIRKPMRLSKARKKGVELVEDPLWFHIVESGFSIWIIGFILLALRYLTL